MFFIYNKALFIVLQIILSEEIKESAPLASPYVRKLHARYTSLSQRNLIRVRELSGNFASLKLWLLSKNEMKISDHS